ncbi:T9SS type A sorting domain-containing protein [uncultured Polaribacter sp.]|uniref:T9SS type A sorting domain-containing protein n=1 Tax=uncultured Polaribacter sp. TaxID=174711 RepID=UPI002630B3DE|nr:T9SS type A sorting domain-containing protein [uncultured Polaribacter sp.]
MKRIIFFLLISSSVCAQTISKQVIGPTGGSFENETNKLSYTGGELIVGAMTDADGTYQLGNGYYPSLNLNTLSIQAPALTLQFKFFPNPTTEFVFISHPVEQQFEVILSDANGKQILKTMHQKQNPISLKNLTKGIYFVRITTKDSKQTNTYKIIKK